MNKHVPSISVCMVTYNASPFLRECLDSILSQTFSDYELLIVDDGSTDDTVDIIRSYPDRRIRLIRHRHDYIASLNLLYNNALGKYIARMDADDIMVSDRLQAQYEYMEAHPETDILGGHMHCFNAGEYDCILPAGTDITMPQMLEQCYVANPTSFIRRSSWVSHHLSYRSEGIYAEDYNLWLDALLGGLRIRNLDKIVVHYRFNPEQISCKYKEIQAAHAMALKDKYGRLWAEKEQAVALEEVEIPLSNLPLTVVIPFYNEREEVGNTLESIRQTVGDEVEVILVDDCSDDGWDYVACARQYGAHYIRNSIRIGAAAAKEKGIRSARSPYFLLLDAHMRFYISGWHRILLRLLQENDHRLLCCQTRVLQKEEGRIKDTTDIRTFGAYLSFHGGETIPSVSWLCREKALHLTDNRIPCILGAGYAGSKTYWDKLKGFQGLVHYGCEELYVSLKAWLEGGGCRLVPEVEIGYIYKDRFSYTVYPSQILYNYLFVAEVLFPTSLKCKTFALAWLRNGDAYGKALKWMEWYKARNEGLKSFFRTFQGHDWPFVMGINRQVSREMEKEIDRKSTSLAHIVSACLTRCRQVSTYGLMDGLTGYVLLFWTYFRYSGETRYEDEATECFNRVCEEIPKGELPLTFRNGIFGIGWAFIYLWEQGYVTYEEVEEELAEADRRALSLSPLRLTDLSLETGLGGLLLYLTARIGHQKRMHVPVTFPETYIHETVEAAKAALAVRPEKPDARWVSVLMLAALLEQDDWATLPLLVSDITDVPDFLPKDEAFWTDGLSGVAGYALNLIHFKNICHEVE